MRLTVFVPPCAAAALTLALSFAAAAAMSSPREQDLARTVAQVESRLDARVGLILADTGSGLSWGHRADEHFLMNSTAKMPVCGAVLARADAGGLSLAEAVPVREADLLPWAPATEDQAGGSMTIAELCLAALDMSDNTAANLLIGRLGGPQEVTQFFRSIGDQVSRLDRREPDLNTFVPGDLRDTSTPAAMAAMLRAALLEDALSPASRSQLAEWMSHGSVTGALLRRDAPADWTILDKSGGGDQTRSLIALILPEGRAPWIAAIFLSDAETDFTTRNEALQELGAAIIEVIQE